MIWLIIPAVLLGIGVPGGFLIWFIHKVIHSDED